MKITAEEFAIETKTLEGRNAISRNLRNLVNTKDWQILMMFMELEYESEDLKLHNIKLKSTPEGLQNIRTRLYYIKEVMGMPDKLAKELAQVDDTAISNEIYD